MTSPFFFKTAPQRILVVTMRYLGDTLLVTPLLNSLKKAYPQAQLDVLVFANTVGILEGNPSVSNIITISQKTTRQENIALFKRIFRRYDLAVCTQTGDRPTLYSFLAASLRIGFVPPRPETGWFKRYFFTRWLEFDVEKTHTVLELLKLCQLLAIEPVYDLTPPQDLTGFKNLSGLSHRYAILHIMPQWRYKQWTEQGWLTVAQYLAEQGVQIVLSGSNQPSELAYLKAVAEKMPSGTLNLAGQLTLAQLAQIIEKAVVFIGVDTGITHLASATGVTTIALFGPSDSVKWTPWPFNYHSDKAPFVTKGDQHVNNVYLIQGQKDCVPCYFEGCEKHQQSYSACLDELQPQRVINVLAEILSD